MLEAVFISDLHLHPNEPIVLERFNSFIRWAAINTRAVYILGDFFHVWAGDDALGIWSKKIAQRLLWLTKQKIAIYYMVGNRDFLVSDKFAIIAGVTLLKEPTILEINGEWTLLAHGDKYCTNDQAHQWFRYLTRNSFFAMIFLKIPLGLRLKIVNKVRKRSAANNTKTAENLNIVVKTMIKDLQKRGATIIIHGHIHKPAFTQYVIKNNLYSQYSLSDWDDKPQILCYDAAHGFYFAQYF